MNSYQGTESMGKASLQPRNVIAAVDLYCRKTNGRAIKRLGSCVGANIGKSKADIRKSVLEQAEKLEKMRECRVQNGEASVTAIDMGVANFAYSVFKWCKTDEVPTLVDWNKINLCEKFLGKHRIKMAMDPRDTWQVGYGLSNMFTNQMPISDLYIIEKQRTRSMSSKNVLDSILLSNVVEHILFSNLRNKQLFGNTNTDYVVGSSSPQKMTKYWCDLISLRTLYLRYAQKAGLKIQKDLPISDQDTPLKTKISKNIRINLVRTILKNAIIPQGYKQCNLSLPWKSKVERQLESKEKFKLLDCIESESEAETGTRKDDDLADSFLHGLTWMRWLKTYEDVVAIVMKNDGSYDQDVLKDFNEYCMSLNTEWNSMSPEMKGNLAELKFTEDMANPVEEEKDTESVKSGKRTNKL